MGMGLFNGKDLGLLKTLNSDLVFFCVSGGGEGEEGVAGPRSAVVFGARDSAGILHWAPRLAASHLHVEVGSSLCTQLPFDSQM